ncbi:hypothetical protein IJX73_02805 [bacterium]|nr:hypothetical protein [bacterium]
MNNLSNLEIALITFVLTALFLLTALDITCIVVERKKTKRADILSFDDGTLWQKIEVKNADIQP